MTSEPLDPATAWRLLQERRIQVVDVRARDEGGVPAVPGARAIPLEELSAELVTLDHDRPVVFISGTGGRSATAAGLLRAEGFNARWVAGGVRAWVDAGLPAEAAGAPAPRPPGARSRR